MTKPHLPWIQIDKDIMNDPRLLTASRQLACRYSLSDVDDDGSRGDEVDPVRQASMWTSALRGALVQLWCYAHDNILPNDVLPLDPIAVDLLVGIEGFCEVMPPEWLQIVNDRTAVKLPHFMDKNQIVKRRQKLDADAKRNRDNRARKRLTDEQDTSSGHPTDVARRDIRDRDKEKDSLRSSKKKATRLPHDWRLPPEWQTWAIGKGLTPAEATEQGERFADYWLANPDGTKLDWLATWRNWIRKAIDDRHRGRSSTAGARPARLTQESALAAIDAAYATSEDSTYTVMDDERIKYDG